ncbi:acyltransferase [Legionella jamestowniensis]|uniref:Chloramphenicol acetyltransferase n=1 Tax=Legionella jamestowniensis TaxID=455 RepID=A0A0W0UG17_9GAMM|nr:acyltransferase [Legionella jamestowniensis]KTD06821.1 chloramphenicol acetyltransferase [Legionella jamestowniensis]SFL82696.1 Hexapeptide repeat of succinyl-transferase [Legionella jamestowniensis DSM 19215]
MKKILKIPALFHENFRRVWSRLLMILYKMRFHSCGNNVIFDPTNSVMTYESIDIGSFVFIGGGAWMSASEQNPIKISSFVMFGPNVTILCGDHEIRQIGIPMFLAQKSGYEKKSGAVTINRDVWIGANAVILKGVSIGEGAVVAAGSVVTKSVPPYTIVAGVPAKIVKSRFSEDELKKHKEILNSGD